MRTLAGMKCSAIKLSELFHIRELIFSGMAACVAVLVHINADLKRGKPGCIYVSQGSGSELRINDALL